MYTKLDRESSAATSCRKETHKEALNIKSSYKIHSWLDSKNPEEL